MRFHQADHHVHALLMLHQVGVVEHVVGLAHAGRRANVDAQLGGFRRLLELDLRHAQPTSTGCCTSCATATGSVKRNVVPWPSRLSTAIWPPSDSTSRRTSARPSPSPVLENGIEAVEDRAQPLRLNAAAGIAHAELHKILDLFGGQQNLALIRRVANRIRQQVVQNGAQRAPVGLHQRTDRHKRSPPAGCASSRASSQ